ncbi:MAG: hypothetical protein L6Q71_11230, partial [Planctomycetes bacterium]|nr:hypothetical protein [Planctomycetota bacterium]
REFIENNLADPSLRSRLSALGQWMLEGRSGQSVHTRNWNDAKGIENFVKAYMAEQNVVLRQQRGQSIRDQYGEFAVPFIQQNYMHSDGEGAGDTRLRARTLLAT